MDAATIATDAAPAKNARGPTLADLAADPRWVAWQTEARGKPGEPPTPTKIPYNPRGRGKAMADNPATWSTRADAEALATKLPRPLGTGGVGIILGDAGASRGIGGLDLDSCRKPSGEIEPWASELIAKFGTYAEVSPSGSGVKLFFRYDFSALPELQKGDANRDRQEMGTQERW
jgi:putative DNA primase/helicase